MLEPWGNVRNEIGRFHTVKLGRLDGLEVHLLGRGGGFGGGYGGDGGGRDGYAGDGGYGDGGTGTGGTGEGGGGAGEGLGS